jgi:hypothetical protein
MAQQRQPLQGKVVVSQAALPGAFIINKQTGTEVKADAQGVFSIEAKNGDRLAVYSNTTNVREFYISAETFKTQPYVMAVEAKAEELEEVVIEAPVVTSESLGLVPENQKRMTVAERRLHTASTGPLDILLNILSGKRKMLERELETERKEAVMENLNGLVNEDEFAALYGIPVENVQAFLFYAVEQPDIVAAVNQGNEELVGMLLMEAARAYISMQSGSLSSQSQLQPSQSQSLPATGNRQPATKPSTVNE